MRKLVLFLSAYLLLSVSAIAQQKKTKVLLLGCFHFDNPGLDLAKFETANVLSGQRQTEIQRIIDQLKLYKPDKIFVEVAAERQEKLDSNLNGYLANHFILKPTETHQLGYRLAKELGQRKLYAVDYSDAAFPFDSLMRGAAEAKQFELIKSITSSIDSVQRYFNESLKKYTIGEMLLKENSQPMMDAQVGWYFNLLAAGNQDNHVGSYLTSEWWRRNMVIYENILKRLSGKEEKILVIFGSGHTALLQQMMRYNKNLELVPAATVLN